MEQNNGKKIKTGILTFAKGDNYGAVLQAYSLAESLRKMGHEVIFLNMTWSTWKKDVASVLTPLSRRFEAFRQEHLKSFSEPCHTKEDLAKASEGLDFCIVGSDQVWNPSITTHRALRYFLDFLPDSVQRVSYAASFGYDTWRFPDLTRQVSSLLSRFKSVSVREDEGVSICENVFGLKAEKVADPTILLGDFSALMEKPKFADTVMGFIYSPTEEYYNLMKQAAAKLDCRPVLMEFVLKFRHKSRFSLKRCRFPSPQTWVTNIANARFVVTDSFHCTVFAILHHRDFAVIPSNSALQGRMLSLLRELGLEDRLFPSCEAAKKSKIWERPIDYRNVDEKIETIRKASLDFLRSALFSASLPCPTNIQALPQTLTPR